MIIRDSEVTRPDLNAGAVVINSPGWGHLGPLLHHLIAPELLLGSYEAGVEYVGQTCNYRDCQEPSLEVMDW